MTHTVTINDRDIAVVLKETVGDLEALRDDWKCIQIHSRGESAFTTWQWLHTWAQHFIKGNRRLFVLALYEDAKLIGIAPWYCDLVSLGPLSVRQIGFLGLPDTGSDYLDVLSKKGCERIVAQVLLRVLFGPLASRWDTAALSDIPAESFFLASFIRLLRQDGKHFLVEDGSFCATVQLPATFDMYLNQLSSHSRQAFRRKMRRLHATQGVEHVVLTGSEVVERGLPELRRVYERRWGVESGALFDFISSYVGAASEAWKPEVSLLTVQQRPIAGLLHLTSGRKMYQYLMAVDKEFNRQISVGNLICGLNIQSAIERGYTEYDFLKGQEEYKLKFMNDARRAVTLRLYNRTARSVAVWIGESMKGSGKILFR